MTATEILPQGSKTREFWEKVREILLKKPSELVLVTSYNHPTLAYRAKRFINDGLNPVFPEKGHWTVVVIKDETSGFYGPRSRKLTYRHDVFMMYIPKG